MVSIAGEHDDRGRIPGRARKAEDQRRACHAIARTTVVAVARDRHGRSRRRVGRRDVRHRIEHQRADARAPVVGTARSRIARSGLHERLESGVDVRAGLHRARQTHRWRGKRDRSRRPQRPRCCAIGAKDERPRHGVVRNGVSPFCAPRWRQRRRGVAGLHDRPRANDVTAAGCVRRASTAPTCAVAATERRHAGRRDHEQERTTTANPYWNLDVHLGKQFRIIFTLGEMSRDAGLPLQGVSSRRRLGLREHALECVHAHVHPVTRSAGGDNHDSGRIPCHSRRLRRFRRSQRHR
jgi:hypothetical protein